MINNPVAPKDEPSTTARVIMTTTNGEIQIDIWARETPLASRNFIQLALEGYYDDTIFHRMIPGFMIQGGDPTGTGTGGQSIYGSPFKDQFHQRLKFGRRGMLAMANSGKDTNNSQFFITFAECEHLNKKHTIFGKVVGDSVYNLLSFQSLDTDQYDRPTYPPYIRKIKVVLNPFDDIIPRNLKQKQQEQLAKIDNPEQQKKAKKNQIKKLKNKNKLTFQQQGQHQQTADKIKSSHDTLNDEKLSKKVAITQQDLQKKRKEKQEEQQKRKEIAKKLAEVNTNQKQQQDIKQMLKAEMIKKRKYVSGSEGNQVEHQILNYQKRVNPETGKVQIIWEDQLEKQQQNENQGEEQLNMQKLRQLQERQYQALRADELNFKRLKQGSAKQRRKQLVAQQKTLLSNVQRRKYQFLKKSQIQKREGEVLSKLNKFTSRLVANNPNDWMCHNLKFHIDSQNAYSLDKNNQQQKLRNQGDDDDGGLKIEYEKYELDEEIDLDELNELAKQRQN